MDDLPFFIGWAVLVVAPLSVVIYRLVGDRPLFLRMAGLYGAGLILVVVGILYTRERWAVYAASIGVVLAGASFIFFATAWAQVLSRLFGWVWAPYRNPQFMRPFVILLGVIAWVWSIAIIIAQG